MTRPTTLGVTGAVILLIATAATELRFGRTVQLAMAPDESLESLARIDPSLAGPRTIGTPYRGLVLRTEGTTLEHGVVFCPPDIRPLPVSTLRWLAVFLSLTFVSAGFVASKTLIQNNLAHQEDSAQLRA